MAIQAYKNIPSKFNDIKEKTFKHLFILSKQQMPAGSEKNSCTLWKGTLINNNLSDLKL